MWEITGAEFSKSSTHTADGISIRFPRVTRIRDDKDWKTANDLPHLKVSLLQFGCLFLKWSCKQTAHHPLENFHHFSDIVLFVVFLQSAWQNFFSLNNEATEPYSPVTIETIYNEHTSVFDHFWLLSRETKNHPDVPILNSVKKHFKTVTFSGLPKIFHKQYEKIKYFQIMYLNSYSY